MLRYPVVAPELSPWSRCIKFFQLKGRKGRWFLLKLCNPLQCWNQTLEPSSDTETSNTKVPSNCEEAQSIGTQSAGQLGGFAAGNTCRDGREPQDSWSCNDQRRHTRVFLFGGWGVGAGWRVHMCGALYPITIVIKELSDEVNIKEENCC